MPERLSLPSSNIAKGLLTTFRGARVDIDIVVVGGIIAVSVVFVPMLLSTVKLVLGQV